MKEIQLFPELIVAKLDHNVLLSTALATVVIPIAHTLLHRFVITPLGQRCCSASPDKKAEQKKLLKFQESCWKSIAYTVLTTGSAYALSKETFWRNTAEFWTDCYQTLPCPYQATPEMNFAYALEGAYYMYAIPYAHMFETRRKDFWATMSHHIVTVLLIGFSYFLGFTKIGLVIMFLHDVCDPFLELAKLGGYASAEGVTNTLFAIFTVLWISMRVVYFPIWVIYSVLFLALDAVAGDADPTPFMYIYYGFAGLLIFLWLLHLFWTYMILKVALLALCGVSAKDTREDDEEEEDKHGR